MNRKWVLTQSESNLQSGLPGPRWDRWSRYRSRHLRSKSNLRYDGWASERLGRVAHSSHLLACVGQFFIAHSRCTCSSITTYRHPHNYARHVPARPQQFHSQRPEQTTLSVIAAKCHEVCLYRLVKAHQSLSIAASLCPDEFPTQAERRLEWATVPRYRYSSFYLHVGIKHREPA